MPQFQDNNPLVEPAVVLPQFVPGTEKKKNPFTEGQTRDAGFAYRMEKALKRIEELESSGFDPVNFKDVFVDYLGGTGFDESGQPVEGGFRQWAERMALSTKYKLYERAKIDFASAQLRKETGAVIAPSEMVWVDKTYFPKWNDPEEIRGDYTQTRRAAAGAMRVGAGKAYDDVVDAVKRFETEFQGNTDAEAMDILRERAQTDEALAARLRNMGLL